MKAARVHALLDALAAAGVDGCAAGLELGRSGDSP